VTPPAYRAQDTETVEQGERPGRVFRAQVLCVSTQDTLLQGSGKRFGRRHVVPDHLAVLPAGKSRQNRPGISFVHGTADDADGARSAEAVVFPQHDNGVGKGRHPFSLGIVCRACSRHFIQK